MFHTYIYNPIFQLLLFIYQNLAFHDFGIAVVFLTILVRIVLFPLFYKGAKDQAIMQKIQPQIKKIQEEQKGNTQEQGRLLMELYKKNKINPFSSIFLLLVQLPIFYALFKIFTAEVIGGQFDNPTLFGLINLKDKGFDFAIIAAVLQFFQIKISMPKITSNEKTPMAGMQKTMLYIAPALTLLILGPLPRALALYWIVTTIFSIIQQKFINKSVQETK